MVYWQNQLLFILLYTPVYLLAFRGSWDISWHLWLSMSLGLAVCALSLAALGVLLSSVSQDKRLHNLVIPLLLFPAALPVLIFTLDFMLETQRVPSLLEVPFAHYLLLFAPVGLYGGLGSWLYANVASDAI